MNMPFHAGERMVQQRMGQADIAGRVGRMIRRDIPAVAANFLAEQSMVVLGAADAEGRMWASQLSGPPGFLRAAGADAVLVDVRPAPGDPLYEACARETGVGLIALQPQRRRRMRVNGTATPEREGLRIVTDQVYSNCPKYVSRREIRSFDPHARTEPRRGVALDERQRAAVTGADTFFLATADANGHADASHRGGNPGFLEVLAPARLRWPDYRGNSMFMTLGNIAVNSRCGILVPDWTTGGSLQLTGTAELVWEETAFAADAQCWIEFTVSEVVDTSAAGPLRWGPAELSPVNP